MNSPRFAGIFRWALQSRSWRRPEYIDRRGNMTGFDSDSNYWSYDRGSGICMNYGTGRMCVGEGYSESATSRRQSPS